jgi:hypothetical protein
MFMFPYIEGFLFPFFSRCLVLLLVPDAIAGLVQKVSVCTTLGLAPGR